MGYLGAALSDLDFALDIARAAGALALRHFRGGRLDVDIKADGSPVTRADREAEELLRSRIAAAHPGDGILGEEFGEGAGTSGRTWILDPVDGTLAFSRGIPVFGTLVALEHDGRAVVGVVDLPALGETMYAARGEGAWWLAGGERRRARVSTVDRLDRALFCLTSVRGFEKAGRPEVERRLRDATARQRGYGDCYGHMLVATGRAEVMVDPVLAPWDSAALAPIVEEAGGRFLDLSGRPHHRGGSGVSVNGALADAVRALLSPAGTDA